jgi:predicted outer membrane protein
MTKELKTSKEAHLITKLEFDKLKHDILNNINSQQSALVVFERYFSEGRSLTDKHVKLIKQALRSNESIWERLFKLSN